MDIVTQGIAGAACAQAFAKPQHSRPAALIGLGAGLLPDADALISSASDPLLQLEYHRHFSHALVFIPIGAALAALLLWPLLRRHLPLVALYRYALLGYGTGGLLDACTSYGTHLLWPFSYTPIAWSVIAIVDPVFTLALCVPLLIGLKLKRPMRQGLVLATAYLLFGFVQHHRAEVVTHEIAASRGHAPERLLVKPTVGNLILWRALYTVGDRVWVDAIRLGDPNRVYPGASIPLFDPERDLPQIPATSRIRNDARRFTAFAQGFTVRHPTRPDFIGDIRYAMLPDSIKPLWGIEYDPANPHQPARYQTNRSLAPTLRRRFLAMLLGRDLPINP
jgi:inner membrane protein